MKHVEVKEFRDHAGQYLVLDEMLTIERHGEPIGYYVPVGPGTKLRPTQGFERLEAAVEQMLAQTGFTEEELAQFFDMSQPLAPEWEAPPAEPAQVGQATDR